MSNLLLTSGVNPIVLDTTGATSAIVKSMRILAIVWDGGTSGTVSDVLALHDAASGNLILSATLAVAKSTLIFPLGGVNVKGIYLTTMSHGTLYIYVA